MKSNDWRENQDNTDDRTHKHKEAGETEAEKEETRDHSRANMLEEVTKSREQRKEKARSVCHQVSRGCTSRF